MLKQEIIVAVEETYLSAKKKSYMGFHGVSDKNLMDHLIERYRKIRASDLEACRQTLAEPIEVDCPIYVYFQQVEDEIQFAQGGETPFTPAQILRTGNYAVNKKRIYSLSLKEWRKKSMTDKMWARFLKIFAE